MPYCLYSSVEDLPSIYPSMAACIRLVKSCLVATLRSTSGSTSSAFGFFTMMYGITLFRNSRMWSHLENVILATGTLVSLVAIPLFKVLAIPALVRNVWMRSKTSTCLEDCVSVMAMVRLYLQIHPSPSKNPATYAHSITYTVPYNVVVCQGGL